MTTRTGCTLHWHDTYSAYRYGCRCPQAREEFRLYQKRRREGRAIPRRLDATGTIRRIRALWALGHSSQTIADHAGLSEYHVQRIVHQTNINRPLRDTIARVYRDLAQIPGRSEITRKRAQKYGYPSPMAWDEGTIDDPNAQPACPSVGADEPDTFDPITVGLAIDGRLTYEQIKDRRADVIEVVRRLATRMNDMQIALHLRWPGAEDGPPGKTRGQGAVCQLRLRNDIPNHHAREVIAPTRTRDRARAARRHAKAA